VIEADGWRNSRLNERRGALVGSIFKAGQEPRGRSEGAFVDIGFEKNAFLHYWTSCPAISTAASRSSSAKVRIAATARGSRRKTFRAVSARQRHHHPSDEGTDRHQGPRVTTHLALPDVIWFCCPIPIKVASRAKSRIRRNATAEENPARIEHPEGMGVIIRTVGEGQQKRYFIRDLALLLDEWKQIHNRITTQPSATCVFQEPDLVERTVRDFLTEDVWRIVIDSPQQYDRMRAMINKISSRSVAKVTLYTESQSIFDRFNISRQLENAFSRQVHLKSGGYIVIDETEALVAIDVNTGSHKGARTRNPPFWRVNLESAEEICRQLRPAQHGGLIVLDFMT